ncbi:hypothetical protein AB0I28_31420 [Phytomonospora sp. NPDC050363]|uniref:hypothetical protein n=1 Tax=Phytomonospora sp. NPDC050363 TaxID=3155642 RepID=UPI00340376B7
MSLAGARIEIHQEEWADEDADPPVLGISVIAWGRAADGVWLTAADARGVVDAEDVDFLVENDGTVVGVSMDGQEDLADHLAAVFPGAEVHYCEDPDDGELDGTGREPIFRVDATGPWRPPEG